MSKILIMEDLQKFSRSIYSLNFIQVGEQWAQNNAQEKLPENMCKYLKKKRYLKNVCTMCEKHEKDLHKFFQDHLYKQASSGLTTIPRRNYEDGYPANWLHLPFSFQDSIFFLGIFGTNGTIAVTIIRHVALNKLSSPVNNL